MLLYLLLLEIILKIIYIYIDKVVLVLNIIDMCVFNNIYIFFIINCWLIDILYLF